VVDEPTNGILLPAERRRASVVFQDYLLFPHLSARDNVAFGLRAQGVGSGEARARASEWLDRMGLRDVERRKPARLSGGQAQRVAIARALACEPAVLLLDEPLAALDVSTRGSVRRDLRRHLAEFTGPTVLVTHDPLDALALAQHVVILEGGRITQAGPIAEVTTRPRSRYVADLIGVNLLRGVAHGTTVQLADGEHTLTVADAFEGDVFALIHPHAVALHARPPALDEGSPRNGFGGPVQGFDLLGDRVRVRIGGPVPLVAEVTPAAVQALDLHEGGHVWVAVKATEIETYPA
jgi:molybdate transport system ATP-binding protein